MTEQSGGFASAKVRLDEIVGQVRKKDTSLEASLDLLEEGVRLANQCTELIDRADWESSSAVPDDSESDTFEGEGAGDAGVGEDSASDGVATNAGEEEAEGGDPTSGD